jgi:hypothetical protein
MSKIKFIRAVILVMMSCALTVYAQSSHLMKKLEEKPVEQILIFAMRMQNLTPLIEATAWKMNYDSALVNSARDKIMVFRRFAPSLLQYRILLAMAPADSAVHLRLQGFWFFPPDSIPRYSKAMKSADRDLLKLFLYALTQEIALRQGAPLHDRALPEKTFRQFTAWNLLNPGLASWYIMKDNPRTAQKSALAWSIALGLLDAGYVAIGFAAGGVTGRNRKENDFSFADLSAQQLGLFGALTFRVAMTVGYFVDKDYNELKKSGYYFPKIAHFNFDTKYTQYIPQVRNKKSKKN